MKERLKGGNVRIRKGGADYLAYSLIDTVVDNYFAILEKLSEKMEVLEEELVKNPGRETLQGIHRMKTDMIYLRRSIWPLREVVNTLGRGESALIKDSTLPYLRDVYDHTIHAIDTLETFRDIVSGMLDIYLSSVSYKLNEIMKVLTIIATIFIPLTFLSRVVRNEFQGHARTSLALGLSYGNWYCAHGGDYYVDLFQAQEVVVNFHGLRQTCFWCRPIPRSEHKAQSS